MLSHLQLFFIHSIFFNSIIVLPLLQIIHCYRWNMPIYSAFFQITHASVLCFLMISLERMDSVEMSIHLASWIPGISFSIYIDKIALIMSILIGCVSSAVQLYSLGYMKPEESPRFFWQLTFFSSMIQILVLSGNLLLLFLAWEGIGVASFLLIGFYRDPASLRSSVVALIANRIGDLGLLFALVAIFSQYKTLDYATLLSSKIVISDPIILCMTLGICIKSAQWPFHFWLPGSMAAPTPVSALLHAATLVTAGIYLLIRLLPLIAPESVVFPLLQSLSCITIVGAGFVAIFQSNIKKLIAYSTISQLGYMVLAISIGQSHLGLFHLWTHGFFKALLFLVAGVAIHRAHDSQKLDDMKGVFSQDPLMKAIAFTALFSLAGIPGFAGFYSKERIIHWIVTNDLGIGTTISAVFGAVLTAMYCGRLAAVLLIPQEPSKKWHASPPILVVSLVLLSAMTLWSGPLGESPYFGILYPQEKISWVFFKESLETGWVLIFAGVFLIVYRLLQKLHGILLFRQSVAIVLHSIEQELHYPFLISNGAYLVYSQIASWFHKIQLCCIEKGVPAFVQYVTCWASRCVVRQQTGLLGGSLMQTLAVGVGFLFLYTIQGL